MSRLTDASDEWVADCRVRAATDLVSHRWDGVVLAALGSGPRRRIELREAIGQVKDKPLTETLGRLTSAGLISRRREGRAALYELTPLGRSFHDGPLTALASWSLKHGDKLIGPTDHQP